MDSLIFPSEESLQIALRSGLVPAELQRTGARVARLPKGEIELLPSAPIPAGKKKALKDAGVVERASSASLQLVSCWAAAIAPRRTDTSVDSPARALFTLDSTDALLELAGELLRLGCDRQEFRLLGGSPAALVRVRTPPWYVLARALDRAGSLRAWVPSPPSQDKVWTEFGFRHPLEGAIEAPADGMLFIAGDGTFSSLPEGEWTDVDQLVDSAPLGAVTELPARVPPRLTVRLKLARAAKVEPPSLWVLDDAGDEIERLVTSTPESALDGLTFAVAGETTPGGKTGRTVVLRLRPGRAATGAVPGMPYARLFDLPNLFAPVGQTVEPPLRRDRLRQWLASDAEMLTWLAPTERGGFLRYSLAEAAFRPLSEWVDYVLDGAAPQLEAWVKGATFDFSEFSARDDLVAGPDREREGDEKDEREPKEKTGKSKKPRPESNRPSLRKLPVIELEAPAPMIAASMTPSELDQAISREEAAFLELDVPSDAPERREAWVRLAMLYSRARQSREAGVCWAHALWEAEGEEAKNLARQWSESSGLALEKVLSNGSPTPEQTRSFVAHVVSESLLGNSSFRGRVGPLISWLDRFDF